MLILASWKSWYNRRLLIDLLFGMCVFSWFLQCNDGQVVCSSPQCSLFARPWYPHATSSPSLQMWHLLSFLESAQNLIKVGAFKTSLLWDELDPPILRLCPFWMKIFVILFNVAYCSVFVLTDLVTATNSFLSINDCKISSRLRFFLYWYPRLCTLLVNRNIAIPIRTFDPLLVSYLNLMFTGNYISPAYCSS